MIINLVTISHKTLPRRSRFRNLFIATVTVALLTAPAFAGGKKAPPPLQASQYPAFDTHPAEHVSIAIDPCNDPKDCDFFRLPYIRHSLIPVRVIITNDSDSALDLNDVRMQFITANNDKLPAATLDDINRRLFNTKQAKEGTRIPLIPIPIRRAPIDKKITEDDNDFGFQGTTVNPHSTLAGYLFYDVKDLDDPPLKDAEIYVKMIHTKGGKELFAFSIPFNKWLKATAAKPSAASGIKDAKDSK
ncbi:MAG: hypothetical protein JST61_06970 [Acidobacteria bacterium]|nr:hypothetical protein [Acidobacteriota bacterium]